MATPEVQWEAIDHVQLAIPVGSEDLARSFYVGTLGLTEVPKPASKLPIIGPTWRNTALSLAIVRSQTTWKLCPPPAAHPGTTKIRTLGMNLIKR